MKPATPATDLAPTVAAYAATWLEERRQLGIVSLDSDRTRLRRYILPVLGAMELDEVRPHHVKDLVLKLRAEGKLAPRTILQIYAVIHNLFHCAAADELIVGTPVVLRRGVLPKEADRDPEWRQGATFAREEIGVLLTDPRIPAWRRIMTALKFFAALRHSEAAMLRWGRIVERKPLGGILLGRTKTKTPRSVPVHPVLGELLAVWRAEGWPRLMRRAPTDADLVVPTLTGTPRARNNCQRALLADLARLGWRRRRGHDLRRSLITYARSDGARDEVLRAITHAPRQDIQEQYTSWPWEVLCGELLKLQLELPTSAPPAPAGLLPASLQRATAPAVERDPAALYLESLAPGSRHTMRWALAALAGGPPELYAWEALRPADLQDLAGTIAARLAPKSRAHVIIALRRVLEVARAAELLSEEDYRACRAALLPAELQPTTPPR